MERRQPMFVDYNFPSSSDFYSFGGDSSSDDEAKSSGDEIDEDFNQGVKNESDSDSFEKEMELELNKEFSYYSQHLFDSNTSQTTEKSLNDTKDKQDEAKKDSEMDAETVQEGVKEDKTYDEIYFSSGSEDDEDNVGGVSSKSKERRTMKTDDELLYDPNMDDEDEKWVKQQRQEHHKETASILDETAVNDDVDSKEKKKPKSKNKLSTVKNFTSDAILSCPACLTTLCIDCQRHDIYKQQFRAMFVMNCKVISDETLRYEAKKQKKKSSKKNKQQNDISSEQPELYNPVQCTLCNTEVAVFDKDEIYHFFNVVESLP